MLRVKLTAVLYVITLFALSFSLGYSQSPARQTVIRAIGTVHDGQGLGVKATIYLKDSNGAEIATASTADGQFTLEHLNPGRYDLFVGAAGFATVRRTVELKASSESLDVLLSAQGCLD